jgi:hypothetical protein
MTIKALIRIGKEMFMVFLSQIVFVRRMGNPRPSINRDVGWAILPVRLSPHAGSQTGKIPHPMPECMATPSHYPEFTDWKN